jgi:hypothetical protein
MTTAILIIDDKQDYLDGLTGALRTLLANDQVEVLAWVPRDTDKPMAVFEAFLNQHDVRLVVTDYDLTEQGQLGFFGATVVDWCQAEAIPVGDFSRGHASSLAKEPNLFELRVPVDSYDVAADYVANIFRGFLAIGSAIDSNATLLSQRSPAAALATMLQVPGLVGQFSQYGIRYGGANSALIDRFAETASPDIQPERRTRARLLTYIMGHLLLNSILRFPGPLLDRRGLEAFLAIKPGSHQDVEPLLAKAHYMGPFADLGPFYWTEAVEEILETADERLNPDEEYSSPGQFNRKRAEALLGKTLPVDPRCERCSGENGGFLCPFSDRTVCQRADCAVVSNVWIPAGARLSRFERGFYDEWAPILGM